MRRARQDEEDAFSDVVRRERLDVRVDGVRLLLVAAEADPRAAAPPRAPRRARRPGGGAAGRTWPWVARAPPRRAPPATRTSCAASARAIAAPIPLEAPVTIAVFPSSPATRGTLTRCDR